MKSAEVMLSNKEEEHWEIFGKSVGLQGYKWKTTDIYSKNYIRCNL